MKLNPITTIACLLLAVAGIAWAERPFIVFDPSVPEELKLLEPWRGKVPDVIPGAGRERGAAS